MCGLFWGAHKSLAPRARTLLGGLGQATLSSFAVATLLFVFFGGCPKFCDLAKQRRKIVGGVSEVGKDDGFSLYFFTRCVIFLVVPVRCPGPPGSCSPVCTLCVWCCVYGVLGLLAPVHRCARSVRGVACTVSWASWLLFTGVHALCVVLRVRRFGPPGPCSPVCTLCVWCCVYGVLGLLAPVHRCARSVCGVACTVSWAS